MGVTMAEVGNHLLQDCRAEPNAGLDTLGLRHVSEVVVRELVGHDRQELLVRGAIQQAARHVELATSCVGGIDALVGHDTDRDLRGRPVSGLGQRLDDPAEPGRVLLH